MRSPRQSSACATRDEVKRFLRDLCTRAELEALAHRWLIARLLDEGLPYLTVADRAEGSTTTVTRVSQWLHHGAGGYQIALERTRTEGRTPERQTSSGKDAGFARPAPTVV